jgi:hypothetical protein
MKQWSRRFVRSRRDRYRIYRSTGGLCARCLVELNDHWEIDHINRWVDGGDSRWGNLQPLCRRCHVLKTTEENIMKGPIELSNWGTLEAQTGPLRRGHVDGCVTACERFSRGERFTSIILPTRYGKSHLARLVTVASVFGVKLPTGVVDPFASCGLFLTHRGFLSRQIIDREQWLKFAKLFGVVNMPPIKACHINRSPARPQNICENGESFAVCNIQMLSSNIDVFVDWVETKARIGRPPVVFADEAQFFGDGDDKKWGPALIELAQAGAFIMPMTATPMRADGGTIPGFRKFGAITESSEYLSYEDLGQIHPVLGVVFDENGQPIQWVKKDRYKKSTEKTTLDAHVTVERREAWGQGYLCRLQRIKIDVKMTNGERFSELPDTRQRKEMNRVLRDEMVINEFIDRAEHTLKEIRQNLLSNAGVIVFVDSTRDGDSHSKKVERLIKKRKRTVIVATEEAGSTEDQIERFVEGEGDYLIVKNSAGAGLDCERIKVCVDLSTVRQHASCEQRWNRAGTPTDGKLGRITVATLITLEDAFADRIFRDIYELQGGECKESMSELIATDYMRKGEAAAKPKPIFVEEVFGITYDDTSGYKAEGADVERAQRLIQKISQLSGFNQGNITIPEGAQLVRALRIDDKALGIGVDESYPGQDAEFEETTTTIGKTRSEVNQTAKRYCRMVYGKVDDQTMPKVWGEIYDRANSDLRAKPGDNHFIDGNRYRNTNDMKVIEVVGMALQTLWEKYQGQIEVAA